jgi:hypothetical protein
MKLRSDLDAGGVARILNLLDAVNAQEPVTLAQLRAAIEGLNWKDQVKVSTQSNINLSSPGSAIDGITLAAGDRVLVRNQSTASQNGIYLFVAAASAMTRALDASTAEELENATVTVDEGTDAGLTFRQSSINFTLGSGDVTFVSFGNSAPNASTTTAGLIEIATQGEVDTGTDANRAVTPDTLAGWSGRVIKAGDTFGDGSTTQFDVTHNADDSDVICMVRQVSDGAFVLCDMKVLDANTVRLNFAAAPTTDELRAVVFAGGAAS